MVIRTTRSVSMNGLFEQPADLPAWNLDPSPHAAQATIAASVDVYEAAIRGVTEIEWTLARAIAHGPVSSVITACANVTRDITAMQLSTARWIFDL